ncbi:MAG: ABC transporter permease [Firmicutes bacterium]|nr:ABC transporter permease [Bacillota bacterium]
MFAHIFMYRLKCLLRDRETIFWTLIFPLLLAVFFNMAFSNLNNGETFKAIDIAVVDNEQYQEDQYFRSALNEVSQGYDRLFNLVVVSKDKAEQLLNDNLIAGYIVVETPLKLVVNKSGMNQSIIKNFLDNYIQTVSAVNSILTVNPSRQQELFNDLGNRRQYVKEVPGTKAEPNNVLLYFYTLIAMACFYGGFFGMREITDTQPNISPLAARINTAPVHKLKLFVYSMSASLLIHIVEMLVMLMFLRFAIRIDFGTKTGYVLLTTIVGSIAGNTFGAFISAIVKKSENIKVGILICVSMAGSFLAGMMYQNMKYIVAQKIPILSYLNPINLLTDAFYCLYYYDGFLRYTVNIGILLIFVIAFCLGIYFIIRRRKYASL